MSASFQGSIEALSLFGLGRQTTFNLSDSIGELRFLELQRSNCLADIDVVAALHRLECLALDNLPALAGLPGVRSSSPSIEASVCSDPVGAVEVSARLPR